MNDASSSAVNSILQEFIKDYGRDAVQDALKRLQCGPDFIPLRFKEHTALRQNIIKAVRWAGGCEHFSDVSDEWMQSGAYRYPIDDTVYRIKSTYQLPPETPAEPEVFWGELVEGQVHPCYMTPWGDSMPNESLSLAAASRDWILCGFCNANKGIVTCHMVPFYVGSDDNGIRVFHYARFKKVTK